MEELESKMIEKFKKNGIPLPLSLTESNVVTTTSTANIDLLKKIENLKRGSNRQAVRDIISSQANDTTTFSPIPTTKRNNQPNNQQKDKKPAVELQKFTPKSDPELSAIENMFSGGGGGFSTDDYIERDININLEQNNSITDVSFKSMPDFESALAKKKQGFTQYATQNNQQPQSQQPQSQQVQEMDTFNFNNLKKIMEEVARDTMEKVLDEYTEKKKNKHFYEVVIVDGKDGRTVIKTETGQHFKLVPVEVIKKKS